MKLQARFVVALAMLALGVVPAASATATAPEYAPETPKHNPKGHQPKSHQPKGRAYGFYCKGESKKHVKGEKGTPFSNCVKAMAKADHNAKVSAREACKALSKKHVKGQPGTPFSACVKGVAQMREDQAG